MAEPDRYPIPASTHRVEEDIKRSRFITTVAYAPSLDEARSFIGAMRTEFADANHNCWAYAVGPPGSTAQVGMSDDGEPHGTAGRPMLTVLQHGGVGDICAVVTRYFGGTLLGKGGLVRAYSGGVKLALESLPTVDKIPMSSILVMIDYASVTPLRNVLTDYEAEIIKEDFAVDVTFTITLPVANTIAFESMITNLTSGEAVIERIE